MDNITKTKKLINSIYGVEGTPIDFTNYWKTLFPLLIDKKYAVIISARGNGKKYALKEMEKYAKEKERNR